MKSQASWSR